MTFHARLAAAGLMTAALLAACSPPAEKGEAPAAPAPAPAAEPNVRAFQVGALQAVALRDGTIVLPAGDSNASPWANTAEVTQFLAASGVSDGRIHLSVQPLLVRDGERVVLIDTGAGGQMGTEGRLQASLREAGVEPGQVTDILISHAHGDHVGGLLGAGGALAFPNATIRISIPEWAAMHDDNELEALVKAITPKVQPFAPGARLTPSVRAVSLEGHTAGHSGFEVASGAERLLYVGDALHSALISVQRPEWTNAWDADSAVAIATRQGLLERAASQNLRLYGVHFPFPGIGRVQRRDDGFVWVPEG